MYIQFSCPDSGFEFTEGAALLIYSFEIFVQLCDQARAAELGMELLGFTHVCVFLLCDYAL